MALGEVFSSRRVLHAAGIIGFVHRKTTSEPFRTNPVFDGQQLTRGTGQHRLLYIPDSDLSHDGHATDGLRIAIASHMGDALVPNATFLVFPTMGFQDGVDHGPANL